MDTTNKMSVVYEETLGDLRCAVEIALRVNDKLRGRYDELPLPVKEKIRLVEGDLLMILNRLPQLKY